MHTYAARLYTGPTSVAAVAALMREAGFTVTIEGTEHVHFEVDTVHHDSVRHVLADALPQLFWALSNVSQVRLLRQANECEHGYGRGHCRACDPDA